MAPPQLTPSGCRKGFNLDQDKDKRLWPYMSPYTTSYGSRAPSVFKDNDDDFRMSGSAAASTPITAVSPSPGVASATAPLPAGVAASVPGGVIARSAVGLAASTDPVFRGTLGSASSCDPASEPYPASVPGGAFPYCLPLPVAPLFVTPLPVDPLPHSPSRRSPSSLPLLLLPFLLLPFPSLPFPSIPLGRCLIMLLIAPYRSLLLLPVAPCCC